MPPVLESPELLPEFPEEPLELSVEPLPELPVVPPVLLSVLVELSVEVSVLFCVESLLVSLSPVRDCAVLAVASAV